MIFRDVAEARSRVLSGGHPANAPGWIVSLFGGGSSTAAGVDVSPEVALTYSAVYGAFRILGESVASLPCKVYRRSPAGRELARHHWAWSLLHDAPNPEMSSPVWRELCMVHLLGWGNAYSRIEWGGDGTARALWPIHPSRVTVLRTDAGRLVYDVKPAPAADPPGGHPSRLGPEDVLHVPALGWTGTVGISPIRLARESVGLGLATEKFGSAFFGSGSMPGGVLTAPGTISDKVAAALRERWESAHQGGERAHRLAVLGGGAEFKPLTIPPEDAQFLETRRFQVGEIARIFRIPPHMLGDLERATFSNVEHLGLEFVVHSLRPWLVRFEAEWARKLFNTASSAGHYAEFSVDGLLRGDLESRWRAYAIGRQWGWLSADEIRERENMNAIPGGAGAAYLVPLNMAPAAAPPDPVPAPSAPEPALPPAPAAPSADLARSADELRRACGAMVEAAHARFVRRERRALERIVARGEALGRVDGFLEAAGRFYAEARPLLEAELWQIADAFGGAYAGAPELEAAEYVAESGRQLAEVLEGPDPYGSVRARVEEWTRTRPAVAARQYFEEVGDE